MMTKDELIGTPIKGGVISLIVFVGLVLFPGNAVAKRNVQSSSSRDVSAESPTPEPQGMIETFRTEDGEVWKAVSNPQTGRPEILRQGMSKVYSGTPGVSARKFLRDYAPVLGNRPDLADLEVSHVRKSLLGTHVRFCQTYQGIPVYGSDMAVHLSPEGRVFQANSRYRPGIKVDMKPRLSPPEAIVAARENLKPSGEVLTEPTAELVIYPGAEEARPAYRVLYPAAEPLGSWEYLIDARDGSVLSCRNQYCFVDGSGRVFKPSPVVTLQDNSLTDQNNTDAAVPEIAYATVTLQGLDGTGVLRGEFADVITKSAGRATDAGYEFFYTRSSRRFEEVMLYYHVDAMQRYIQSLGFTDANNEPQRVYADSHPGFPDPWVYDQSLYMPGDDYIAFGIGGVDDAEDAEIIAHEYGHAIQHDQVPGFPAGMSGEGAAIGEGWGDYWAADYCARMSGGWQDIYLGEWDATSYRTGDPPYYLRRLDSIHHYPDDFTGDAYNGGEIWSSALWAIRATIGSATTTTIALQSHFLLDSSAKFGKAVNAFLDAEEALYGQVYRSAIIKEFQLRGFWPYEVELSGFDLSFDVPVVIPDYTVEGVESTLTVDSSDVVSDSDPLLVYIDLQHDAVKDLRILLRSPGGTEVLLHDRTGGDLEDFEIVYGESRIPRESLSKFDGESIEGTWTLQITDRSSAHGGGVLNGWGLSYPRQPATGVEDWDAMD